MRKSLESIARSKKSLDKIQVESLMPSQLLDMAENMVGLLHEYYNFMNTKDFSYVRNDQRFTATVNDSKCSFRTTGDEYFFDTDLNFTKFIDYAGNEINVLPSQLQITGGNELPAPLELSGEQYGSRWVLTISGYESQEITVVTQTTVYVGDQPSRVYAELSKIRDINEAPEKYLEVLHYEYASAVPQQLKADKILLYKNLIQFYRERGSQESIEVFFKLLLGDIVEVYYPRDDLFTPSSGTWDPNIQVPEYDDQGNLVRFKNGKYLDNGGFLSDKKKLQDSFFYQKFSYVIRTGSNVDKWKNAFSKLIHPAGFKFFGEIAILIELINQRNSIMPEHQPGFIGAEDIPVLLKLFGSIPGPEFNVTLSGDTIDSISVTRKGYRFRTAPTIVVSAPDIETGIRATAEAVLDQSGRIASINITNVGSGYVNKPRIKVIGRRDRVAEFLPVLVLVLRNRDNDYLETLADQWLDRIHFYDNTSAYAFESLTLGALEDKQDRVYFNVGSEIYSQTVTADPTLSDTQTKINQGYL